MRAIAISVLLLFLAGCTQYYRVTDVSSRQEYITDSMNIQVRGFTNTMTFRDQSSGKMINLQSYEIEKISQDEARAYGSLGR